jgi:hypothetical protein
LLPQVAGVAEVVAASAGGWVMLNICVAVHPAGPDVTVTVYVPAQRFVALALVPPDGAHAYVYVPVPPVAATDAVPVHAPLHRTFVCVGVKEIAGG